MSDNSTDLKEIVRKPPHPGWGLIFLCVLLGWLTFSMWLFASDFDDTEGKAILTFYSPLVIAWGIWFWGFQIRR